MFYAMTGAEINWWVINQNIVVLHQWEVEINVWFINRVDCALMFRTNAKNVSTRIYLRVAILSLVN